MRMSEELSEYEKQSLFLLEEMVKWTRLQGKQQAKKIIETLLNDESKRLIFHLSDGRSSPETAKIAKVSSQTVRNYWKTWAVEGIAKVHPDYKKRYVKLFSLEEFGIEPPEIAKTPEKIEDEISRPKKGRSQKNAKEESARIQEVET